MNEYFRPTRLKIILAIVIFLLLPVPARMIVLGGPDECGGAQSCFLSARTTVLPFGGLFLVVAPFVGGNQPFERAADYLWKAPLLIIVAYLLACFIGYFMRKK